MLNLSCHFSYHSDISDNNYIGFLDGMRSGKTSSALLLVAHNKFKTVLIVCPAMLKGVWEKAINETIVNPKINELNSNDEIKEGYFNLVSYDVIHTIDAAVECCILDESHYLIKAQARRSEGVMNIKAGFRIVIKRNSNFEFAI